MSADHEVAVLGVGMHPWGKWGRNFVEYGIDATQAALADAGSQWSDIGFVAGADTIRNGYPGFIAGATMSQALGLEGQPHGLVLRRVRLGRPGPRHRPRRRSWPGSATSPSWSAPTPRPRASSPRSAAIARTTRTGCGSACSAPPTPPTSPSTPVGAWSCTARPRRTSPLVKVKNARHGLTNPNARYHKEFTVEDVMASPDRRRPAAPARHLRHLRRRRRGDPHVDGVRPQATTTQPGAHRRHLHGHPDVPADRHRDAQLLDRLGGHGRPRRTSPFRDAIAQGAYEEAGLGPDDLDLAEVYDLSLGARARLVREHRAVQGGRGRAPASATATPRSAGASRSTPAAGWPASARPSRPRRSPRCASSRGTSGARPATARSRGPRSGSPINQGLFGHGSSVIVTT